MTGAKQFSVWVAPHNIDAQQSTASFDQQQDNGEENKHRRYRRCRAAYEKAQCCCRCVSSPLIIGALVGALVAGIGLATAVSLLVDNSQNNTTITSTGIVTTQTTVTSTTTTVSTVTTSTTTSSSSTSTSTSTATSSSTSTSVTTTTTSTTTTTVTVTTTTSKTTSTATSTTSRTTTTTTSTTTTGPYCTTRVTFDDIPDQSATYGPIPNGYNNLNWTNVNYANASAMPTSGFQRALKSPSYVAYNVGGNTMKITTANGTRFAFNSIVVSAAWRDQLVWFVEGYNNGVLYLSGGLYVYSNNQTTITCGGCTNFDTLIMYSYGGTPRAGLAQNGTEFAFDDLCISFGY